MASSLRSGGVCEWFDAAHGGCICLSCFDVSAATDTTVIIPGYPASVTCHDCCHAWALTALIRDQPDMQEHYMYARLVVATIYSQTSAR